jgi:hypothetical protein
MDRLFLLVLSPVLLFERKKSKKLEKSESASRWANGVLVSPGVQAGQLGPLLRTYRRLRVTVPNFVPAFGLPIC